MTGEGKTYFAGAKVRPFYSEDLHRPVLETSTAIPTGFVALIGESYSTFVFSPVIGPGDRALSGRFVACSRRRQAVAKRQYFGEGEPSMRSPRESLGSLSRIPPEAPRRGSPVTGLH